MPTTGHINGTLLVVEAAGQKITGSTNFSLNLSHATREATNKDSGGFEESLEGLRNGTIDGEGLYSFDGVYNFEELFALYNNRTKLTVFFTTQVTGDIGYQADAFLTELSADAGTEETTTLSFSFQLTGTITESTIT